MDIEMTRHAVTPNDLVILSMPLLEYHQMMSILNASPLLDAVTVNLVHEPPPGLIAESLELPA